MKPLFSFFGLILICLFYQSCDNENTTSPITVPIFVHGEIKKTTQFWDNGFDPYPVSALTGYLSQGSADIITKFVDGLSFLSEYIGDNYEDLDLDALTVANAYLVANSESTILAFPDIAYDFENDIGYSTTLENAILTVMTNADFDEDPADEESYEDFVDAIEEYNIGGLPNESMQDSVAAILYMGQILMHWEVYETIWYDDSQPQVGGGDIGFHPRRICLCPWCLCYIGIKSSDIKCAEAVIGGTLLGGSAGGIWGAIGGGLLAKAEFCP